MSDRHQLEEVREGFSISLKRINVSKNKNKRLCMEHSWGWGWRNVPCTKNCQLKTLKQEKLDVLEKLRESLSIHTGCNGKFEMSWDKQEETI